MGARAKRIPDCWSEVVKCVLEAEAMAPEHGGRSALRGDKFSTGQTRGIISEIVPVKILVCILIKFSRFWAAFWQTGFLESEAIYDVDLTEKEM